MASTPPPAPQYDTPPPPVQKRTSPWVWVAVGCGGILVVILVVILVLGAFAAKKIKDYAKEAEKNPAMAAAKLVAAANPDIEVVSSDEDANTITLRNKKTGETVTLDVNEVKQGRIKFRNEKGEEATIGVSGGGMKVKTDKGEMTLGGGDETMPSWVPEYPHAEVQPMYSSRSDGEYNAGWRFETPDAPADVLAFFEDHLKEGGFTVSTNTFTQNGKVSGGLLTAKEAGDARQLTVTVSAEGSSTSVSVAVSQK